MYLRVPTLVGQELGRKTYNTTDSFETVAALQSKATTRPTKNQRKPWLKKYIFFLHFIFLLFNLSFWFVLGYYLV